MESPKISLSKTIKIAKKEKSKELVLHVDSSVPKTLGNL